MSAQTAFERLSRSGVRFVVRDGSVVAKPAELITQKLAADIELYREALRAAALAADELIQSARAKEARA